MTEITPQPALTEHPRFGDFGFQTVVDTFQPRMADMQPSQTRFGLHQQVQYLYGGFRDAEGVLYAIERKFVGPMTGGAWIMSDESGHLALHPRALSSARGESIREFTPDRRRWSNHLMQKMGERVGAGGDDQPLELVMTDDDITYSEGELLELTGPCLGPGFQYYMPMRDEPLFYTTHAYWVRGTFLGKEVDGFLGFDHGYWAAGAEWKEYRVFEDLELTWEVFGNRFGETIEWGVIVKGRHGLAAAITFEDGEVVARADTMPTSVVLDDEDYIASVTYDIGGVGYEFTAEDKGKMREFSDARWGGYKSVSGITRRVGDDRPLDNCFSWIEFFPDRIREDGLAK